jgi:lipopolysaccharide/colanic/teichoic acid biosynthesis glycosyltransferase
VWCRNLLSPRQKIVKRIFDIIFSFIGLVLLGWLILLAFIAATVDTGKNGFFTQVRVGKDGKLFKVIKIRTMRDISGLDSTVTAANDPRITKIGAFFRKTKIDELPQLINVLLGHMSFVGPRPDVPGYADQLPEEDRKVILSVRPGITGPATIKYRAEEEMLAAVDDPETYNREVIFPDKVRINREYIENYSFINDLRYIWATVFGVKNMRD